MSSIPLDSSKLARAFQENPNLTTLLMPKWTKYIPITPTAKQLAMLLLTCREALWGGAAGGGKSAGLLMAGLQYVDTPGYNAIIFRRSYKDLSNPGALMSKSHEWLDKSDAHWDDDSKSWHFPSGATLSFGYLDSIQDKYKYQSAEYSFCGFDELTQFSLEDYTYMFSRLRRTKDIHIPLRMRSATNPGNRGHEWVRQRFLIEGPSKGRVFIPARLDDNPYIDREAYIESLSNLDAVTRRQLLDGDWTARQMGACFKREWFNIVDSAPANVRWIRAWDLAGTEPSEAQPDPDYTSGALLGTYDGRYWLKDVRRLRASPLNVERAVRQTAELDGRGVAIVLEQEPGQSGKAQIARYQRDILRGFAVWGKRSTGDKVLRAEPVRSAAEAGLVSLVRGPWIGDFLDEAESFGTGATHDDQIDALSLAFDRLTSIYINVPKVKVVWG